MSSNSLRGDGTGCYPASDGSVSGDLCHGCVTCDDMTSRCVHRCTVTESALVGGGYCDSVLGRVNCDGTFGEMVRHQERDVVDHRGLLRSWG
jgi:hypothetical protein